MLDYTNGTETLSEDELCERYDEALDEIYGEPMGYPASRVLKSVDPIAYRVGFNDWTDADGWEEV